jgi:hypothetical protein
MGQFIAGLSGPSSPDCADAKRRYYDNHKIVYFVLQTDATKAQLDKGAQIARRPRAGPHRKTGVATCRGNLAADLLLMQQ